MTVPSTTRRAGPFLGNGSTTTFAFPFKVFAASDIAVYRVSTAGVETLLTLTADYSVTLNPDQDASPGGSVTPVVLLASGEKLTIIGATQYTQELDLPAGGNFNAKALEDALDRTTFQVQQIAEAAGRALTLPPSAAGASSQLPTPSVNAVIGWNAAGTALQNIDPVSLATVVAFGTSRADTFTGNGVQTVFTLTNNPGALANLDIAIGGVTQVPGVDYTWAGGTNLTFTSPPPLGVTILARYFLALPQGTTDSASSLFIQGRTGAVQRVVQEKLREGFSVRDFGATGDGATNDTTAFSLARSATAGRYFVPPGTYVVDASPDVWADPFFAGPGASLKIAGITYDVSNSFLGPLRYVSINSVLYGIVHAKTGNTIQLWQDGTAGTATYFYKTLAFKTDSHFIQAKPATVGGTTDLLLQRSDAHPTDPNGNRFTTIFEEAPDRLLFSYATATVSPPLFDAWMEIVAASGGGGAALNFPALRPNFRQGFSVQTRVGGALKLSLTPGATQHALVDETSGNTLGAFTRSFSRFGGIAFNNLADTPNVNAGPQRWGAMLGDLNTPLPVNQTLFTLAGATRYAVVGTLRVAASTSTTGGYWREARFTHDGATLTVTDIVNTLPVQIVATIAMSGSNLQFQSSYAGGLGAGVAVCVSVEWSQCGR